MRGSAPQVFERQGVHIVAAARAVEYIGLQHGVESDAAQLHAIP